MPSPSTETKKKTGKSATLKSMVGVEEARQSGRLGRPIQLRGVRVRNLKNVDVDIPAGKLTVVCGKSGSGKTSLVLDTLYAEGQRRFIESFSAYTRQFLDRIDKPDYDSITNLPPATAVTRGGIPRGNRSTVGTASECHDLMRLLFAKVSRLFCHSCGDEIVQHSPQSVTRFVQQLPAKTRILIGFEIEWVDKSDLSLQLVELQQSGFIRFVFAGRTFHISESERNQFVDDIPVEGVGMVVVDRVSGSVEESRLHESLELAFSWGDGVVLVLAEITDGDGQILHQSKADQSEHRLAIDDDSANSVRENPIGYSLDGRMTRVDDRLFRNLRFSRSLRCHECDIDYPDPDARLFSFNSPLGACEKCEGFGDEIGIDMNRVVPDSSKSIREGAIAPWNTKAYGHELDELVALSTAEKIRIDVPFSELSQRELDIVHHGSKKYHFGGLDGFFAWLERKKYKMHVRVFLSRWRSYKRCRVCHGGRLNSVALSYKIAGKSLADLVSMQVDDSFDLLRQLCDGEYLSKRESQIAADLLIKLRDRLGYLQKVGLGYLSLDRTIRTLSGGEAQRVTLTGALGSSLVSMLYVLDEPTVGLHPADTERLNSAILSLRDRGNTLVVIEHEQPMIESADHIIEVGPEAGQRGGKIVFCGELQQLKKSNSLTGKYLHEKHRLRASLRQPKGSIFLKNCSGNNLRNIDVQFPLGVLCLVTGISGSGKSTLVQDTLYGALCRRLKKAYTGETLDYDALQVDGNLHDVILVDQSPISRSPKSNAVTYLKSFDEIRKVFAAEPDAVLRNYTAGHFSFNSKNGRCSHCDGDGQLTVDMHFLADVQIQCPNCFGTRYKSEILDIRYRNQTIADVLAMTVDEAIPFFRGKEKVQKQLSVLQTVGLGYLQLGQPATTLSAGEAQRLKLASFLSNSSDKPVVFLLDEPTTGLHFADVEVLIQCFHALLDMGHSLIVVEHNEQLMMAADHIIDIGPGAASEGGTIAATGTPQDIIESDSSVTGRYLKHLIEHSATR